MRTKTAFIFLLFANLFLLAHAVIPHHHHKDNPVPIPFEWNHYAEHSHHDSNPFSHDDHHEHETKDCCLSQTLIVPNNQLIESEKVVDLLLADILFLTFYVCEISYLNTFIKKTYEIVGSIPLPKQFSGSSQGLRAPPVC